MSSVQENRKGGFGSLSRTQANNNHISKALLINNKNLIKDGKIDSSGKSRLTSKGTGIQSSLKLSKAASQSNLASDSFKSRNVMIDEKDLNFKTVLNREFFINESVFDNERKMKYSKLREEFFGKRKTKCKRRRSCKNVTKKKSGSVEPPNDSAFNKYLKLNSKEKLNQIFDKTKKPAEVIRFNCI